MYSARLTQYLHYILNKPRAISKALARTFQSMYTAAVDALRITFITTCDKDGRLPWPRLSGMMSELGRVTCACSVNKMPRRDVRVLRAHGCEQHCGDKLPASTLYEYEDTQEKTQIYCWRQERHTCIILSGLQPPIAARERREHDTRLLAAPSLWVHFNFIWFTASCPWQCPCRRRTRAQRAARARQK